MGARSAISADGWLYNRNGFIAVNPDIVGTTISRYRFERHLNLSFVRFDSARTSRFDIGYRHDRQGARMDLLYHDRPELTAHAVTAKREWIGSSGMLYRVGADIQAMQYRNRTGAFDRMTGDLSLAALKSIGGWQSAATVGSRYTKSFKALPYALATAMHQSAKSFLHLSVGYTERAPTQHELFLPHNISTFQSAGVYADSGNPALGSEKQLIGTIYCEYGTLNDAIGFSVASGRIRDAIDWVRFLGGTVIILAQSDATFIVFATRLHITDFAHLMREGLIQCRSKRQPPAVFFARLSGLLWTGVPFILEAEAIHFSRTASVYTGNMPAH